MIEIKKVHIFVDKIITKCKDCPFFSLVVEKEGRTYTTKCVCRYGFDRIIENPDTIPNWCPFLKKEK